MLPVKIVCFQQCDWNRIGLLYRYQAFRDFEEETADVMFVADGMMPVCLMQQQLSKHLML